MKRNKEPFFRCMLIALFFGLILSGCISVSTDKNKGKLHILWEYAYELDNSVSRVNPLLYNDMIITSVDGNIFAHNYNTGEQLWKTSIGEDKQLLNSKFGVSNDIITGSFRDQILAWNISTGEFLWRLTFPDSLKVDQYFDLTGASSFFIAVGSRDNRIYKISLTGTLEIIPLDARSYEITIHGDNIYITQRKGYPGVVLFSAYNLETMELLWRFDTAEYGYPSKMPPIIDNEMIYVGAMGGPVGALIGFFALDARTGEEIWRRNGLPNYSALLAGDDLYVNAGGGIQKIRKENGAVVWHLDFGSLGLGQIAYQYGYIYAISSGIMHIIDSEAGKVVFRSRPPDRLEWLDRPHFWNLTAGAGRIFAQSEKKLYAFAPWGYEEPLE